MTTVDDNKISMVESLQETRKQIIEFSNSHEFLQLDGHYRSKSFWETVGIERNENKHSNFLAWLLSPEEYHGLDTFSIQKLLQVVAMVLLETSQQSPQWVTSDFFDSIIAEQCKFCDVEVCTEHSIQVEGRMDIFIKGTAIFSSQVRPFCIIVENKIKAKETKDQTVRYQRWMTEHRSPNEQSLLLLLTPLSTLALRKLNKPNCKSPNFIQINYQYLLEYLLLPAMAKTCSEKAKVLLGDYIRALSVRALDAKYDKDNTGGLIMAISEQEQKLLTNFWEKHKALILAAMQAISQDANQDEDTRHQASKFLEVESKKDYSLYNITYDGKILFAKQRKTRIGYCIAKALVDNGITLDKFIILKNNKTSDFLMLKTMEEMTDGEKKYNRYPQTKENSIVFEGKTYFAIRNWGVGDMKKLRIFLQKNFSKVDFYLAE